MQLYLKIILKRCGRQASITLPFVLFGSKQIENIWSARALLHVVLVGSLVAVASTLLLLHLADISGGATENFGRLRVVTAGYGYGLLGMPPVGEPLGSLC